uniref:Candidate secreted effector n=1 Tax=Meloidogyne incognita TaxID=6306 RepID=A0A914L6G7_MELIC
MTTPKTSSPANYLVVGVVLLGFVAIFIGICIYCFVKKRRQRQQQQKTADPYDLAKHKSTTTSTKKDGNKSDVKKERIKALDGSKATKTGSKMTPCPSGVAHGVAVPMTIDSILTVAAGKKMSTMKAIDTKPPVVDEAPMSVTIKGH